MDTPATTTPWSTAELLSETRWMRALAGRLAAGTGEDPDDVVQDALVAALERRPAGDRPLRPWFARVVRNQMAFARRGAARRRARERAAAATETQPPADELLERAELHARVVRALTELREPQRGVLLERFFGELSPSEIARRRGVPAATVRTWIHRGLAELRAELDRSLGDDPRRARRALLALAGPPADAPTGAHPTFPRTPRTPRALKIMNPAALLLLAASTLVVVARPDLFDTETPSGTPGPPPARAGTAFSEPAHAPGPSAGRVAIASPAPSAPAAQDEAAVTGTVRDAGGAPLAGFALELRHAESGDDPVWSEPELLLTNEDGHFSSLHEYAAGQLSITMIDHADLSVVARFARQIQEWSEATTRLLERIPDPGPIDLRAWVGPSFDLDLSGLGELEPGALGGSLEPVEDEPWGPRPSAWTVLAPVRVGEPPWIRFPRLRGATDDERPWRLTIEGADGLVAGEALVQVGEGVPAESVAVVLLPAARLDVTLTVGGGIANPAVALEADPGGERRPMLPVAMHELGEGEREVRFARTALAPGTYRVLVSVDDHDQLTDTVTLVAGEVASRAFDLGEAAAETRLSGELRSQSGTYHETTFIHVSDAAGKVLHHAPVQWLEQNGQWVAPFAVDSRRASRTRTASSS